MTSSQGLGVFARTRVGRAVICGPAPCLHADLERLRSVGIKPDEYFAVNRAFYLTHLPWGHLVSCHPDMIPTWIAKSPRVPSRFVAIHAPCARPWVDAVWGFNPAFGSSGGLAVLIALVLGHSPIYLAGIPLENTGYADDPESKVDYTTFHKPWLDLMPFLQGCVFSLSGPDTFTGARLAVPF